MYVRTVGGPKVKNSSCWISPIVHSRCDFVSWMQTEKQLTFNSRRLEINCASGSSYLYWSGKQVMDVGMGWEAGDLNSSPSETTLLLWNFGQIPSLSHLWSEGSMRLEVSSRLNLGVPGKLHLINISHSKVTRENLGTQNLPKGPFLGKILS